MLRNSKFANFKTTTNELQNYDLQKIYMKSFKFQNFKIAILYKTSSNKMTK